MRRVAAALGIATMSLYNYVPAKDHLAELMIDQIAGEYTYPPAPAGRRAAIAGLARQARDIARHHPWLTALIRHPASFGPNGLRYLDYFLGLLADSGLDTGAKMEVIALISGFATMYGRMQAELAAGRAGGGTSAADQASAPVRALARAAASSRYPHLAAALATAGPARGEDEIFESCIARLIDVAGPDDAPGAGRA